MADKVKESIKKLLVAAGVKGEINLTVPPKPEMGDLAFACFDIAKEWKMSPPEAAKKLESGIKNNESRIIEKATVFGPYLNFYLNAGEAAKLILEEIFKQGKNYGASKVGKGKQVLLEYPSNNTHKELHIGHLRNICIGNALTGLFNASGYKAVPINYLNDFGAHVAKCLWWILKNDNLKDAPAGDRQKWLGEQYAEASRFLKEHKESEPEVWEVQKKIEAKDKSIWPLFMKTRQWSLDGFDKIFKELGVRHKTVFYEKDVKAMGQKMVDELLKKGIAKVGEGGALIADLEKYDLDIALLRKANGSGLYLTSDLGLALAKNKKYKKTDESIHITGSEQNFYFKQLFKILELAGYDFKMTHIGYGLVNLPTGKISSREGNVVLYEDLREAVMRAVEEKVKNAGEKQDEKNIKKIALAAVKFEFLKHEAGKNFIFNEAEAVSFEGFSGPYVLYALARINSILKKSSPPKSIDFSLLDKFEEKNLILSLGSFGEMVDKALAGYNPSVLTRYAFDTAKQFSDFYGKHSVLNAENRKLMDARLYLCAATRQVLENTLRILSIDSVEKM